MVINTDPVLRLPAAPATTLTDQKLVIAHVYGHCDFFKNNAWFAHTTRQDAGPDGQPRLAHPPLHRAASATTRSRQFIDACLSIEDLIDLYSPHIRRATNRRAVQAITPPRRTKSRKTTAPPARGEFRAKGYMDALHQPARRAGGRSEEEREAQESGGRRRGRSPRSRRRT